ncbi:MAG: hypothetical protein IJ074_04975 [Clostridia bacterium]|nr:hypothetical protein [Clostridia bacterium]
MEQQERMEQLARRVLSFARNTIVLELRFLDMALYRLPNIPSQLSLATDGRALYYQSRHIIDRYRQETASVPRDMLHTLLHCVFRHPFIRERVDPARWNLACDIAVEYIIDSMGIEAFSVNRCEAQRRVFAQLTASLPILSADKLYRHFEANPPQESWFALFHSDDHQLWHVRAHEPNDSDPSGDDHDDGANSEDGQAAQTPYEDTAEDGERGAMPEESDAQEGEQAEREEPADTSATAAAVEEDTPSRAMNMRRGDEEDAEGKTVRMRSEAGGESGNPTRTKQEEGRAQNQNVGPGMDSEGLDGMPAGSQSRNDRAQSGYDSSSANGSSGDAGGAASQSDASTSGGSGSGLNDAEFVYDDSNVLNEKPPTSLDIPQEDTQALEREWRDIGERIQMDLETTATRMGSLAGNMLRELQIANRERIDYSEFLRRFMVLGEVARLNPDEFDPIYYTYGLGLYGNLPLIEPQETRETHRIRDFVIAIDTSGSTSGGLVARFLEVTQSILQGEENFFARINLHIVQCDAQIQEIVKITSQEDLREYIRGYQVKGMGGTDFRPVFEYIDEQLHRKTFDHLKGLIYLTDGYGTFPAKMPNYDAAFVFLREDPVPPQVPPWVIRIQLNEEDIENIAPQGGNQ